MIINININEYSLLYSYKEKINDIFLEKIKLNKDCYTLIGIIFYKNTNEHFVCLNLNLNDSLNRYINKWLYYDDIYGKLDATDNYGNGFRNYRQIYASCLFIYSKF